MPPVAVAWDFDGTLVDSRARNYAVACRIVAEATGRPARSFAALASEEAYEAAYRRVRNWRELYTDAFGFDEALVDELGALWTPYQLADATPVAPFPGIVDTLRTLGTLPHGIVSQNARANITRMLEGWGLAAHFGLVIGYEEVASHRQKPAPDGLLACIEQLLPDGDGTVVYVGDHEADTECARNAAAELEGRGVAVRVVAVAARFGGLDDPGRWTCEPDHVVSHPQELLAVVSALRRR